MRTLALLGLLAAPVSASVNPADCKPLPGVGCYYIPQDAPVDATLVVYMRGYPRTFVAPDRRPAAAQGVFAQYGLGPTAETTKHVVLVTGHYTHVVTEGELSELERATGRAFPHVALVLHSGAGEFLPQAVNHLSARIRRLVLMDVFYVSGFFLADAARAQVGRGASCVGFFTPHGFAGDAEKGIPPKQTEEAVRRYFPPERSRCAVEKLASGRHESAVRDCLAKYLITGRCL